MMLPPFQPTSRPPGYSPPPVPVRRPKLSEFGATNMAVLEALEAQKGSSLQAIETSGGHGGFYLAEVDIPTKSHLKETHRLFLKPFDEAEFNNFSFIQKRCEGEEDSSILKFMPRVYGKVTIDGKDYIVMANLRNRAAGKEWKQVADLKITKGGQFDEDELTATGRTKDRSTAFLMKAQSMAAQDYLTLTKSKLGRSINALHSESAFMKNLTDALDAIPEKLRSNALQDLLHQLGELHKLLETSPMGFIGASVFIFSDNESSFKIYLADPAHAIAEPTARATTAMTEEQKEKMYWGPDKTSVVKNYEHFCKRREWNCESIKAMHNSVEAVHVKLLSSKKTTLAKSASTPSIPTQAAPSLPLRKAVSHGRITRGAAPKALEKLRKQDEGTTPKKE